MNRQEKRKAERQIVKDREQWHVKDWQSMKFYKIMETPTGKVVDVWVNETYQVFKNIQDSGLIYLSIKRNDRLPIRNWQHMQQIKNDICGREAEGCELYPAMSRLADSANQYHMWVLPNLEKFPFGLV